MYLCHNCGWIKIYYLFYLQIRNMKISKWFYLLSWICTYILSVIIFKYIGIVIKLGTQKKVWAWGQKDFYQAHNLLYFQITDSGGMISHSQPTHVPSLRCEDKTEFMIQDITGLEFSHNLETQCTNSCMGRVRLAGRGCGPLASWPAPWSNSRLREQFAY